MGELKKLKSWEVGRLGSCEMRDWEVLWHGEVGKLGRWEVGKLGGREVGKLKTGKIVKLECRGLGMLKESHGMWGCWEVERLGSWEVEKLGGWEF